MEVKAWSYEELPEYEGCPDGAERLSTTGDEIGLHYFHDVEYAVVDGVHLHLQIVQPITRNEPFRKYPCVVYVQGSAWMEQDVYAEMVSVSELAKRGYVLAIVQYRHSGQAQFPAQIQDMKNAIRFLKIHAEQYRINPQEVILAGCSSGGHTAMFNSIIDDYDEQDMNLFPYGDLNAKVRGILDYYGSVSLMMEDGNPTTLNHKLPYSPEGMLFKANLREHPELAKLGTVVTHITPELEIPPVCIFHGTKDLIVNTKQSVELYEKLKEAGKDVRLYLIEGASHGGGEFWTKEAVDKADEFIQYCLKL
jgi:acetyl esterase/lipase